MTQILEFARPEPSPHTNQREALTGLSRFFEDTMKRRTKRTKEQDPNQLSLYGGTKETKDPSKEERSPAPAPAREASPAPARKDRSKYKDSKDFSKTTGIYFSHRRYPALILEYIGPLYYPNGDKVPDFVSVRCMNDLGLRAYSAGAYTAEAKRMLSPYRGELPDPHYRPATKPEPKAPAPNERIHKTNVKPARDQKK